MGQRLTIQLYSNEGQSTSIATLYFHWSAYTLSALEDLKLFYSSYKKYKEQGLSDISGIYCAVAENGGGLSNGDTTTALELYPELHAHYNPDHNVSRSQGLVAFTDEQQEDLMSWSEGNIQLYLEEGAFTFDILFTDSVEEEYFIDDYDYLLSEWFNRIYLSDITIEEVKSYCEQNLPEIDYKDYHHIKDIPALKDMLSQHSYFYDKEKELFISTID